MPISPDPVKKVMKETATQFCCTGVLFLARLDPLLEDLLLYY